MLSIPDTFLSFDIIVRVFINLSVAFSGRSRSNRHHTIHGRAREIEKLTVEVKQIASKAGANLVGIVLPRAIDALPKKRWT